MKCFCLVLRILTAQVFAAPKREWVARLNHTLKIKIIAKDMSVVKNHKIGIRHFWNTFSTMNAFSKASRPYYIPKIPTDGKT